MASKVGAGHAVPGLSKRRCKEAVRRPQVAHPGDKHDERAVSGDVIGDAALGAVQVESALGTGW